MRTGNVNVSKLGGLTVGPGGFIDIAQNARKVVFCGTFDAKGADVRERRRPARHRAPWRGDASSCRDVEQITFSGASRDRARGSEMLYVTERAVFRLTPQGLVLAEVAPGVDVRRDVLERMEFAPLVPTRTRRSCRRSFSPTEVERMAFVRVSP